MNLITTFQITPADNIAIVGGGGKSSLMFALGRELAQARQRVLLTTTTRIFAEQIALAPTHLAFDPQTQGLNDILSLLKTAFARHNQVLLIGKADEASGKAFGLTPDIIDAIARRNLADVIINEADGSRMRPFKAPAAHEPVIPASATLVIPAVGLDALGKPLNDNHVHRAALVAALSKTPLNAPVTPQTIAAVLTHPHGGLKNVPPAARVVPLLNKLDTVSAANAHQLAQLLLQSPRVDSAAVGSLGRDSYLLPNPSPDMGRGLPPSLEGGVRGGWESHSPIAWIENRVAAIVLAAGGSSRFGGFKQMTLLKGKPLFLHAVDAALASQAEPVIVVLGARAKTCRAALGNRPVQVVVNSRWQQGQSTSMQAGLNALPGNIAAAVFPLADQPFVAAEVIDALITRYRRTLAKIVLPEHRGKRGNPVLFDRRLFSKLRRITGDTGARPVLLAHLSQAQRVAVSDAGVLQDVDRPEDLKQDLRS